MAVGLRGEEGGAPPAKRTKSSLVEEAMYAMGVLAGDPRANVHNMELLNKTWPGAQLNVFLRKITELVKISCTMIYALVSCAPCQAPSSICSLNRRTYALARPS
jgi:hypothetical protein